jgi:hypothetical protein
MGMVIWYLKEGDLVFKPWVGGVRLRCTQGEMIKQMAASQICFRLGYDFGALHCLSIPERRAVLTAVSFIGGTPSFTSNPTIVIRIPCASLVSAGLL